MNDITGLIVLIVAVACMLLAQRKTISKAARTQYSLMGTATSVLIAVEAARRAEAGVMLLFGLAAIVSLAAVIIDHLKPTNPDA